MIGITPTATPGPFLVQNSPNSEDLTKALAERGAEPVPSFDLRRVSGGGPAPSSNLLDGPSSSHGASEGQWG